MLCRKYKVYFLVWDFIDGWKWICINFLLKMICWLGVLDLKFKYEEWVRCEYNIKEGMLWIDRR